MIIGSRSGPFGLFTNPGSPCYPTLRQCPLFRVPIAEGEHAETMPVAPGPASRTMTPAQGQGSPSYPHSLPTGRECNTRLPQCHPHQNPPTRRHRQLVSGSVSFDGEDRLLIHSFLVQFNNPGGDRQIIDQQDFHFFPGHPRASGCSVYGPFRRTPNTRCWYSFRCSYRTNVFTTCL